MLVGSVIDDAKSVGSVSPLVVIAFMVVAGLFKNLASMPMWYGWLQYFSPLRYGFITMV